MIPTLLEWWMAWVWLGAGFLFWLFECFVAEPHVRGKEWLRYIFIFLPLSLFGGPIWWLLYLGWVLGQRNELRKRSR